MVHIYYYYYNILCRVFTIYTSKTNHVSVAAIQYLQLMVHVMLFPMTKVEYLHISTLRSMPAVPSMDVFCSSLVSRFLATLLRYFVNDFYKAPVVLIITGIVFFYIPYTQYFYLRS